MQSGVKMLNLKGPRVCIRDSNKGRTLIFLSVEANSAHLYTKGLPYTDRVSSFVFNPTQKVASKTFKETNHTDDFCYIIIVISYYHINTFTVLALHKQSPQLVLFVIFPAKNVC